MEFRNCTKKKFELDTEDDLNVLKNVDNGSHPELASDLQGVILEEYTLGTVSAVETETIEPNAISDDTAAISGITHTKVVCDDSNASTHILATINPTTDIHINEETG